MKYTIKEAIVWLSENRKINTRRAYLNELCYSNRLKSELLGRMRFIKKEDLEKFEFKKAGRPKTGDKNVN